MTPPLVIGIAIDKWKLKIFQRRLAVAGHAYTEHPGIGGTLLLKVKTTDRAGLLQVVEAANREAARTGRP